MIGRMLSHYRIVEKLGEGGMGVVWKAVDTKLDREVAIKVLPEELARDAEHLARFEREARMLAALNHRNIAAIYGLDQEHGQRFLVMELVQGEDLGRKLARGALPVEEALDLCHQLARALEAAHEKGVLHRDLKPANIQVTPEGRAKVLDFGLAKPFEERGDVSRSPTLTSAGTRAGTILGTAGYMSPEQARGKPLDKRTDIWSFGCVLYQCLTGRSPFAGETISDTLAAILKTEPDWTLLPERTPPRVRELLQRCLEKDVRERLRDAGDARIELQRSMAGRESDSSGAVAAVTGETRRPFPRAVAGLALVIGALLGAGIWSGLSGESNPDRATLDGPVRLSLRIPDELVLDDFRLSPSGSLFMAIARSKQAKPAAQNPRRLYLRRFDDPALTPLAGSEGVQGVAFSPDGRWVAMLTPVSPGSSKLRLAKVPADGSTPPLTLLDWPDGWRGPIVWLPDGDILAGVSEPRGVVRIPSSGGRPRDPVALRESFDGVFRLTPTSAALAGGSHVLGEAVTYSERGYDTSVAVLDLDTGEARTLVEDGSGGQWSPTGHLLFSRHDTLLAVPFDPEKVALTGGQVAVADGLRVETIWDDAPFRIAPNGTLVHLPGGIVGGARRLALLDASYKDAGSWSDDRRPFESGLRVSPDGRRLAVTIANRDGLYETWVSDVDQPRLSMLVHEPGADCLPHLWSRDGSRLVYSCGNATEDRLYLGSGDGIGEPRLLLRAKREENEFLANAFLPDESQLILTQGSGGVENLVLLPIAPAGGPGTPAMLVPRAAAARVSPDGAWLAYDSQASGRSEVYLRSLAPDGGLGPEIPVTKDGGNDASWYTGPGTAPLEVRYLRWDSARVESVTITPGPRVRLSEPRVVSGDLSDFLNSVRGRFDAMPDGRTIAIVAGDDETAPREASVALNWLSDLRSRTK